MDGGYWVTHCYLTATSPASSAAVLLEGGYAEAVRVTGRLLCYGWWQLLVLVAVMAAPAPVVPLLALLYRRRRWRRRLLVAVHQLVADGAPHEGRRVDLHRECREELS